MPNKLTAAMNVSPLHAARDEGRAMQDAALATPERCCQHGCSEHAVVRVLWPNGYPAPRPMCIDHAAFAVNVGQATGFHIHVEPITVHPMTAPDIARQAALIAALAMRSDNQAALLRQAEAALTHGLGLIVEFGDLNGFRNMTDEELGRAVISVAAEMSDALAARLNEPIYTTKDEMRSVLDDRDRLAALLALAEREMVKALRAARMDAHQIGTADIIAAALAAIRETNDMKADDVQAAQP